MKAFVTGATGYIGSAVCRALQQNGIDVLGLARTGEALDDLAARGIAGILGDLAAPIKWSEALDGIDGFIHLASPNDETAAALDQTAITHVIERLSGSKKSLVYTSGTLVYGSIDNQTVDEARKPNPIQLVAWRPAIEDQVLKSQETGVVPTVIRPAWAYGSGGGVLALLQSLAQHAGGIPVVGDGQNVWSTVHVNDLADAYVRAFTSDEGGEIYNVASSTPVSQLKIAEALASVSPGAQGVSHLTVEEARSYLGYFADALSLNQDVSSEKVRQMLSWEPKSPSILESMTDYSKKTPGQVVSP